MVDQLHAVGEVNEGGGGEPGDLGSEIKRLFAEEKYEEIRSRVPTWLGSGQLGAKGYYWLARVCQEQHALGEALVYINAAHQIAPRDVRIAAKWLDLLYYADNLRAALVLYETFPKKVAKSSAVQSEMYWIYRAARWMAKARQTLRGIDSADRHKPYMSRPGRLQVAFLSRTVDRFLLKLEERQEKEVRLSDDNLKLLERQSCLDPGQKSRLHAEVDEAILQDIRLRARWSALVMKVVTAIYGVLCMALVFVSAVVLVPNMNLLVATGALGCLSAVVVIPAKWLFDRSRTYFWSTVNASGPAVAATVFGLAAWRALEADATWTRLVATGLFLGATIGVITGVFNFVLMSAWYMVRRKCMRRNARGWIVAMLADVLIDLPNVERRADSHTRRRWLVGLEEGAKLIEYDLADQIVFHDLSTREWMADWFRGVAASFRHMKRHVVAPTDRGWCRFDQLVRQQLMALSSESWRSAHYREPLPQARISARDRLIAVGKFLVGAVTPGACYVAIAPLIGAGGDVFKRALLLSVAWAMLSLLFIVDPAVRDKTTAARDILGEWRPMALQKGGGPGEEKAARSADM